MLTFEEFFLKKKIDLIKLQSAEPSLFAEFNKHYPLMGEKSFDHTKKYWFNNLRRTYPLAEEPKPHKVRAEAISHMAVQGVAVAAAQNVDAGIERPKFKEDNLSELIEANVPESEVSLKEEEKIIQEAEPEVAPAKPVFKPRFNAKNIKKPEVLVENQNQAAENLQPKMESVEPETENPQPAIEPEKPAFKPRFNMQNTKKEPVKTVSETAVNKPEPEAEIKAEPAIENPQPNTEEAKPVYKPRFQMKNIQKPATENPATGQEPATENPPPAIEE